MSSPRYISLWFPYFGAERVQRIFKFEKNHNLAIIENNGNTQTLSSVSFGAHNSGLNIGQPLQDAKAICPGLMTRVRSVKCELTFLHALCRWYTQFTPWVAADNYDGVILNIKGCAHLFGGEEGMLDLIVSRTETFGLTVTSGVADTVGGAWALARFTPKPTETYLKSNSIDQEARATRSRATKKTQIDDTKQQVTQLLKNNAIRIAPAGNTYNSLANLPITSLRIENKIVTKLNQLGLKSVKDLLKQPRAPLARRFGPTLIARLDQALGHVPETISPITNKQHFDVRISFPEPIGLIEDIKNAIEKLLIRLCNKLKTAVLGFQELKIDLGFSNNETQSLLVSLACFTNDPERIFSVLLLKLDEIKPNFGIDIIRLEAINVGPITQSQSINNLDMHEKVIKNQNNVLKNLITRLGTKVGLDAIIRHIPAQSHIPEKSWQVLNAAWSNYDMKSWPTSNRNRPSFLWPPEALEVPKHSRLEDHFIWRKKLYQVKTKLGPERIAPEWWIEDNNWRSGVRDYWQVRCNDGEFLWLFYAHGAQLPGGWFCHGKFG